MSIPVQATPEALVARAQAVLARAGAGPDQAAAVADALVEADLLGHGSHGLRLLPLYLDRLRSGLVSGTATPISTSDDGAIVRIDANRAFGQVAGAFAARLGTERAKRHGLSLVVLDNSGHLGRNGKWPEIAARDGVASIHFAKGRSGAPNVAPYGGRAPQLYSSPIALGAPNDPDPIILDMSVAEVSINEVKRAAAAGERLASACIVDAAGALTDDPAAFVGQAEAAVQCFGGFKGFGLAVFAEIFAGILAPSEADDARPANSLLSVYVDVARLADPAIYATRIADLADRLRATPPLPGHDAVTVPGDRSRRHERRQRSAGLDDWADLDRLLSRLEAAPSRS